MKIKTSELTGQALDWATGYARCIDATEGKFVLARDLMDTAMRNGMASPSTEWAQGGQIIWQEHISLTSPSATLTMFWTADIGLDRKFTQFDHDPLIAAMRCYVAYKLGETVDVPDELLKWEQMEEHTQLQSERTRG